MRPTVKDVTAANSFTHDRFHISNIVVGLFTLSCVIGFLVAVNFYSTTVPRMENNPLVFNMTKAGIPTRISFEESPCLGSNKACFTSPEFDDGAWANVNIPRDSLASYPGYQRGQKNAWMYYRFRVPVSKALFESSEEIAFSPLYVYHRRFQVYVNGRLVETAGGPTSESSMLLVSIPRSDIIDGFASVVLRASIEKSDTGIQHLRSLYVGPKTTLGQIHLVNERSLISYFLLFLLTKGSVFVVFTLFFFFTHDRRALFHFLVYAFFVTWENFFAGGFVAGQINLTLRGPLYFLSKTIAIAALLSFFVEYFQAFRARSWIRKANLVAFLAIFCMCLDFGIRANTSLGPVILKCANIFLLAALITGSLLGMLATRMWARSGGELRHVRALRNFTIVILLYLALTSWEFFFNQFFGFDKRAIFDLMFFYYMAFITAKEFGFNQGQVITLEGHMQEKLRMEQELQEAAVIAKAFLPGQAPEWPSCEIAVYHRSLSESSGDWYTFEESPTGNLYHMIMCDITGHGVQAAIVVSTCRTVLSSMIAENKEVLEQTDFIAKYAHTLNEILIRQGSGHHVTTLLGLSLDRETGKLYYLAAGHPLPLLISPPADTQAGRRTVKPLVSRFNVLGVKPQENFSMKTVDLRLGDEVVAFTDGLPVNAHLRVFTHYLQSRTTEDNTVDKTVEKLADADVKLVYEKIWAAETEKTKTEPNDDVSIIWLRRTA